MKNRLLTKHSFGVVLQLATCSIALSAAAKPEHLVVGEGFVDPIGFHDATPTFSWKLPPGTELQTGYQIEVRDIRADKLVWDSGWVDSAQSVFVPYGGEPLNSRQQLSWRVRFRDETENDVGLESCGEIRDRLVILAGLDRPVDPRRRAGRP